MTVILVFLKVLLILEMLRKFVYMYNVSIIYIELYGLIEFDFINSTKRPWRFTLDIRLVKLYFITIEIVQT